jgi:energy-coupling factor transport system ATP-binding protein
MDKGKLALTGAPSEVFENAEYLESIGLDIPQVTKLINKLNEVGFNLNPNIYTIDMAKKELLSLLRSRKDA